jgi:hypothetical protein
VSFRGLVPEVNGDYAGADRMRVAQAVLLPRERVSTSIIADVRNSQLQFPMAVYGSCQCGKVRIEATSAPKWVADCNCSLCRRLAWRVAYFPPDQVHISGEATAYVWGDRMIGIHHCPTCGCGTHWQTLGEDFGKMGVNARLLDDFDESAVEVRKFDNAG